METVSLGTCKCRVYKQVVFIRGGLFFSQTAFLCDHCTLPSCGVTLFVPGAEHVTRQTGMLYASTASKPATQDIKLNLYDMIGIYA